MKYRKKPVVIEAIQFKTDGSENIVAIQNFMGNNITPEYDSHNAWLNIKTLEGTMKAIQGDWIIKGVNGEFYPCKPDIFKKTYDAVDSPNEQGERK